MSIHKGAQGPVNRFDPLPKLEKKLEKYLKSKKIAPNTTELRQRFSDEDPVEIRQALYNLRNEQKIRIVTFETNRIHWMHVKWVG